MEAREGQHARSARRGEHGKGGTSSAGRGGVWHHGKGGTRSGGLGGVCHHGKGGTLVVQDEVGCGSTENRIPSIGQQYKSQKLKKNWIVVA